MAQVNVTVAREWLVDFDSRIDDVMFVANPWAFAPSLWFGALVAKALGVALLDLILLGPLYFVDFKRLPSRVPPIMKGLVQLGVKDWTYLAINQTMETVFLFHLFRFVFSSPGLVLTGFYDITFWNTILPMYPIFVVDDFFYYFAHRLMHVKALYPYCHKHHHRQALPKRGYFDAANENPIEQMIAYIILAITFTIVSNVMAMLGTKLHAAGVLFFFIQYAITAVLNHTEFDINLGFLWMFYNVRAHETHHRFPQTNYAQNVLIWDKLFGTFREYKSGQRNVKEE